MKRKVALSVISTLLIVGSLNAQKSLKEVYYDPAGKAKITNLKEVQIDEAKNEMRLYFLTKSTLKKIKAEVLTFDLDFNLKNAENIEEDYELIKEKYKLKFSLDMCPESKEPLLTVEPNMSGQVVFKKGYIHRYYNWDTGLCDDRFKVEERVKPKGDEGEKIKLVNYWTNNTIETYTRSISFNVYNARQANGAAALNTLLNGGNKQVMSGNQGTVVFLGLVAGGIKDAKNWGKAYTFQKFDVNKLEKVNEVPLTFDVQAAPIFHKILSNGNIAYIFHRADNQLEYLEVDYDGNTQRRFQKPAPIDATWVIDDLVELEDGSMIAVGVLSKSKFTKSIGSFVYMPHNNASYLSPHATKPQGFQVMKISNKEIDWISVVKAEEFKSKFIAIPQDKKGKPYAGGALSIGDIYQAKSGHILVTGQKKKIGKKVTMGEMVCFYFDSQGQLLSNFATIMRDKNKYNMYQPSNHSLLNSPTTKDVYWIIYEVAGMKAYRSLFYPRIARIKEGGKSAEPFVEFGGKKAFLDDKFPINYVNDKTYIFIGSNRNGKELWFNKVEFE